MGKRKREMDEKTLREIARRTSRAVLYEQMAEECVELAHACMKMARILRGDNPTPADKRTAFNRITEELSDLYVCRCTLNLHPNIRIADMKAERWLSRLKEKKGKKVQNR